MSENVISLRNGQPFPTAPRPNTTVIEELERLLEAARAGEIIGIAASYTHKDKQVTYSYAGSVVSYPMIGGLDCLKERIVRIALSKD
jgi:hypothetical protein